MDVPSSSVASGRTRQSICYVPFFAQDRSATARASGASGRLSSFRTYTARPHSRGE